MLNASAEHFVPAENVRKGAERVVQAAGSAANLGAAKAAEAGESLNESLKHAASMTAEAVDSSAETVEQQAERLKRWASGQEL